MAWKNKPPISLYERVRRVYEATQKNDKIENISEIVSEEEVNIEELNKRIEGILKIVKTDKKSTEMLFFIMYDIESNKVRNQVVKYLLREGCSRIQKSIFLAKLPGEKYKKITSDLALIQTFYKNEDSILIVPISIDYIQAMKIIGKNVEIDVIMKNKNTLFF